MGKKMSGSNSTGPTKAGKKHQFKEPAQASAEKRDARLAGEQQFVRPKAGGRIDVVKETGPFDGLCRAFGVQVKHGKPWDTGYRYDDARKRVVVPEGEYVNGY